MHDDDLQSRLSELLHSGKPEDLLDVVPWREEIAELREKLRTRRALRAFGMEGATGWQT